MKKLTFVLTLVAITSFTVASATAGDDKKANKKGCCSHAAAACGKGAKEVKSANATPVTKPATKN